MEHNYIEDLLFFKKNAVENIISTANWDIENYFEMKDEAAEDEDIDFEENGDCEEYGRDYRFDEDEVEDAINFLFYYEECLPDDTDKAINDYRKRMGLEEWDMVEHGEDLHDHVHGEE